MASPPISKITEERVRIAKTTESKERAGADLSGAEESDAGVEAAESKESRRGSENRIAIEFSDRFESS